MENSIKALIVDDEKLVRQGMISIMPWKEYDIEVVGDVNSGEKALEFLEREEADLLITDLAMPVMSGIELIRKVKALYPHIWTVVLTFHQDFNYIQEALRLGAIDFILKTQLEKEQMGDVLARIVSRINDDRRRFGDRKTDGSGINCFIRANGLMLVENRRDFSIQLLRSKPFARKYRVFDVDGSALLLDGYDTEEERKEVVSAVRAHFPDCLPVEVHNIRGRDISAVVLFLKAYIKRRLFYEFEGYGKGYKTAVHDQEDPVASPSTEQELREGWSSFQWIYDDEVYSYLLTKVKDVRPEQEKLESIFYSVSREWERSLSLLNTEVCFDRPVNPKYWADWTKWISDVRRLLREKTQKPAYSQDIAKGIMKALDYINRDDGTDIKQENMARLVGMSRGYFSQCFRDITGTSFNNYIRNVKISKAKFLLIQTNKPIYWISEQTGYLNEKHFSRVFHELTGMLPTEYRNKYRGS